VFHFLFLIFGRVYFRACGKRFFSIYFRRKLLKPNAIGESGKEGNIKRVKILGRIRG